MCTFGVHSGSTPTPCTNMANKPRQTGAFIKKRVKYQAAINKATANAIKPLSAKKIQQPIRPINKALEKNFAGILSSTKYRKFFRKIKKMRNCYPALAL